MRRRQYLLLVQPPDVQFVYRENTIQPSQPAKKEKFYETGIHTHLFNIVLDILRIQRRQRALQKDVTTFPDQMTMLEACHSIVVIASDTTN